MISKDDIKKLANLARIEVTEGEQVSIAKEIDGILAYVGEIQKAVSQSESLEVKPHLRNVFREDVINTSFVQKELIESAPEHEDGFVKVKKIL